MIVPRPALAALMLLASQSLALNFTISNGQIFTPGFVILDAPQPNTPLGGDILQVAIDVTADGKLSLPPYPDDSPSQIFNITMFLYSYDTGRNFTIDNGTEIMEQEPSSTVKHVNWEWPDCLVGNGSPTSSDSDRGNYNISIRQNFRLNGTNYYTIFDVPIAVTNSIESNDSRPSCNSLNNKLLSPEEIDAAAADKVGVLFAPGEATQVDTGDSGDSGDNSDSGSDGNSGSSGDSGSDSKKGGPGLGNGVAALSCNWGLGVSLVMGLAVGINLV